MQLLTIAEAARRLRLGKSTLYALCTRGDLPSVRVGAAVRVCEDDLATWIERHRREPDQGAQAATA